MNATIDPYADLDEQELATTAAADFAGDVQAAADHLRRLRDYHAMHTRHECVASTHDHTTHEDGQGGTLELPVPMNCQHCGLPSHYDTVIGDYQHDDTDAPDCFLITRREQATDCQPDQPAG